ncbi:translation initiation factor IF-2 [Govanella unica]|uniref:Translation initiation factor IF-2 n=1 Tax=Govanella unica TaxID=2975056 RepID=A0A9X3U0H4_9PROT|nr:translation initiation factor IF-2 [Govania unica]MDA5194619.1 translation initiation factor IF-2 [Govania unica]
MSDKDSQEDNKLAANRQTLQLKKSGDAGPVRPSLAPTRGKATVVVEHKRKLIRKDKAPAEVAAAAPTVAPQPTFDSSILKPRAPDVPVVPVTAPVQAAAPVEASAPAPVEAPVQAAAPAPAPVRTPAPAPAPIQAAGRAPAPAKAPQAASRGQGKPAQRGSGQNRSSGQSGGDVRLTEGEREVRFRALESAKRVQEEMRLQEAENSRRYAEEKARRDAEDLAAQEARRRRDEEARRKQEDEDRLKQAETRAQATEEARTSAPAGSGASVQAKSDFRPEARGDQRPAPRGDAARGTDQRGPRPGARPDARPDAAPARAPAAHVADALKRVGAAGRGQGPEDDDAGGRRRSSGGGAGAARPGGANRPAPRTVREDPRKGTAKLTVTRALSDDDGRTRSLASIRRRREKEKRARDEAQPVKIVRDVVIPETITVQELANRMAERSVDVIKALMKMDVMATINEVLDADTAEIIVADFGHKARRVSESDVEIGIGGEPDRDEDLRTRPPVVTIMGHVDHGKTSLLDALRTTNVVSGESGGITQHIGAYQVTLANGAKITFLDTPGHEAFTAMRSRGAKITDIVVLVVAADDGVMPQTIEAINHAKAAEVPMIIAINKMDKPGAKPERIRQELLQHGIVVEEMSGDVLDVEISAKERTNLDKLTDAILLQAELLELKADPNRPGEGVVVEAELDRGRGPVATVLVKRGTLRVGDVLVAGCEWGKVRALLDDKGRRVEEAGPSLPVVVLGLNGTPSAGDDFAVVETEARGREIADFRLRQRETKRHGVRDTLETMFERMKVTQAQGLPLLVKADVQGSTEAIVSSLQKLNTDEVAARIVHSGVGSISETDVTLAKASNAPILAFNVRANAQARDLAEREGVEIRHYSIIYDLINDIKAAMSGLLAPERKETVIGMAEVLQVFQAGKTGKAAGGLVIEGTVRSGAKARLLRDNVVIYDGELGSLRRFKDEVKEVRSGIECGMSFVNYTDLKVGDKIEVYEVTELKRSL